MPAFTLADAASIAVEPYARALPWASESPPWSFCGDRKCPDFGTVFATPGACGSTILWFDRDERGHAMTVYAPARVGGVVELLGRLWKVKRLPQAVGGFPHEAA